MRNEQVGGGRDRFSFRCGGQGSLEANVLHKALTALLTCLSSTMALETRCICQWRPLVAFGSLFVAHGFM